MGRRIRTHRFAAIRLFSVALVLAFALRALVPHGYMPRGSTPDFAFVICHGVADMIDRDTPAGDGTDDGEPPCPFAALTHRAVMAPPAVPTFVSPPARTIDSPPVAWAEPQLFRPAGALGARAPPELL